MNIYPNGQRREGKCCEPGVRPLPTIDIGERVRRLRREQKWTLDQTSRRTGMSLSALSKIERGELSPTLTTLEKLASGFGIEVAVLLSSDEKPPASGWRSINRMPGGAVHRTATCRNTWLAVELRNKRMLPIRTRVTARTLDEYSEWQTHPGEIFVYVLKGTLVVHSELYEPEYLTEDDSMYYDAAVGTKWTSSGPQDAEVLWVYTHAQDPLNFLRRREKA